MFNSPSSGGEDLYGPDSLTRPVGGTLWADILVNPTEQGGNELTIF